MKTTGTGRHSLGHNGKVPLYERPSPIMAITNNGYHQYRPSLIPSIANPEADHLFTTTPPTVARVKAPVVMEQRRIP